MSVVAVPRLHVVTDDEVLRRTDFPEAAARVLAAGGEELALHLRGPAADGRTLHALAAALLPWARAGGTWLLVNDRVDVALTVGLDGVHLARRSLPLGDARGLLAKGARIGVSCHAPEEIAEADAGGADYVFAGTIFPTPSHRDEPGMGERGLARCVSAAPGLPVIAIGGIVPERVAGMLRAGAHGVAVIRGVWSGDDPASAVGEYLEALARATEENDE